MFGRRHAVDRDAAATPAPHPAHAAGSLLLADDDRDAFAAAISLLLAALAATAGGVRLAPAQWAGLALVNMAGVLPFAAIGLWIGTLVGGNAAPALLNVLYLPMAFLSGLWLPLSMLPGWLAKLAPAWPAYHLGQLALKVVGHDDGGRTWAHVAVLALATVAFFALARRRLHAGG